MRRRLLFFFTGLVVVLLLVVATVPLWLGAALAAGGRSRGLTFARYERVGYARFALHDVDVRYHNVHVTAKRVEADTPVLSLWRHWQRNASEVAVTTWLVDVEKSTATPPPSPNPTAPADSGAAHGTRATPATQTASAGSGWVGLEALLQRIATQLDRWLPVARTGAGAVRFPAGEIALGSARWANRQLTVDDLAYRELKAHATLAFPADAMRLALRLNDGTASAALEGRAAAVAGEVSLWDQPAKFAAEFAPRGWLPARASLQADNWTLPGARLKLGDAYADIRGHGRIDWSEQKFEADLAATGEPVAGKKVPPLNVTLRGHGDAQAFTAESMDATLPGITARLSEPVTIERSGKLRESAARFLVQADLAKQPWFAARGTAEGEARVVAGANTHAPAIEFRLQGRDVAAQDVAVALIETQGRFAWPRLEISAGRLVGGEGEELTFHGGWDFRAQEILPTTVEGKLRRASLARWLPAQPQFDVISLHAEAAGPLADVRHAGHAEAQGVKFSAVKPIAVTLEWRGQGAKVEAFSAVASAGATSLHVGGAVDREHLALNALELNREKTALLRLAEPATIRWAPNPSGQRGVALQIDSLQLTGPDAQFDAAAIWGEAGRISIAARNIPSGWFTELVQIPGPAWRVNLLALTGTWNRGPMTFTLSAGGTVDLGEGHTASVAAAARGDKDGMRIEALRATESDATVLNATGRLPLTLRPATATLVNFQPDGALQFEASAAPNALFWQQLAAATGVELKEPQATVHIAGTWQRPEGEVRLQAARVALDAKRFKREFPSLAALNVQLTAHRDGVQLDTFAVSVEGQTVRAHGHLPIPHDTWSALFKDPLAFAQRDADLRLEVPDAEMAVFARFLPAALAPQGRLQLDVTYKNGGLDGSLHLRNAASRPLGPLGVLQEINADVALAGRKLDLRGVTAKAGGQPVTLAGTIELIEPAAPKPGSSGAANAASARGMRSPFGGQPRFNVTLRGENLPFVRQTGLLVRGDLDLKLQTPASGGPAALSGSVKLRDSLFLQDVRAFLPGRGGASGAHRPPYFEISTPPLNTWTLSVDVTGDRFMRLRTPVFNGVASARFHLGGTLGEPRAIGGVTIDEGRVRMPFASFDVKQGAVRLTEANPYEPTIYLRGLGRHYGYDLTMEIEGTASAPNVNFSSSPALETEQVVLMVMTGSAPQSEINKTGVQRVAQFGAFLGQTLLGTIGSDASDPDRLSIATGEKISRGGKETYDIEYRLSDRWTATGEYNEFDEYNAGLKWRVMPRTKALAGKTQEEDARDAKK